MLTALLDDLKLAPKITQYEAYVRTNLNAVTFI